jgi:serine/threonine-protein kinase
MTTVVPAVATRPLLHTRFSETGAAISSNGRWLAYQSDESGRSEVYVRPFPDVDNGRWQISNAGGVEPRWAKNGRELFYTFGGGPLPRIVWSAAIRPGPDFNFDQARVLAKLPASMSIAYDVAADGRFLFHAPPLDSSSQPSQSPQIVVVEHWLDELRARVPLKQK